MQRLRQKGIEKEKDIHGEIQTDTEMRTETNIQRDTDMYICNPQKTDRESEIQTQTEDEKLSVTNIYSGRKENMHRH